MQLLQTVDAEQAKALALVHAEAEAVDGRELGALRGGERLGEVAHFDQVLAVR